MACLQLLAYWFPTSTSIVLILPVLIRIRIVIHIRIVIPVVVVVALVIILSGKIKSSRSPNVLRS